MKQSQIKEVNNSLPENFQNCTLYLEAQVQKGSFTAWSLGNEEYLVSCYWADEALPLKAVITTENISGFHPHFDLASLTKPFFLNSWLRYKLGEDYHVQLTQQFSLLKWHEQEWNKELLKFVNHHKELTLDHFLSHNSHLKSWVWCKQYLKSRGKAHFKKDFVKFLLQHFQRTEESVYSDLNYQFLLLLIESLWPEICWEHELENLNAFNKTHFFHAALEPKKSKYAIPSFPYSIQKSSANPAESKFFGVVHDTNANLLASAPENERIISGHAGFYGNIADVLLGVNFLQKTQPEKLGSTLEKQFSYGLQSKENALGHLGYTGTSFWFHPKIEASYKSKINILLTNRTASRSVHLDNETPRIFTITNLNTKSNLYFMLKGDKLTQCEEDDVLKKLSQLFAECRKSWDDTKIPTYKDLSEVRKKIETEIW